MEPIINEAAFAVLEGIAARKAAARTNNNTTENTTMKNDTNNTHPFAIENMTDEQVAAYEEQFGQKPYTQAQYDDIRARSEARDQRLADAVELATREIPFVSNSNVWKTQEVNKEIENAMDAGACRFVIGLPDETNSILVTAIDTSTGTSHALFPLIENGVADYERVYATNTTLNSVCAMTYEEASEAVTAINKQRGNDCFGKDKIAMGFIWSFHTKEDFECHDGRTTKRALTTDIAYVTNGQWVNIKTVENNEDNN